VSVNGKGTAKTVSGVDQGDERKRTTDEVSKRNQTTSKLVAYGMPGQIQGRPAYCLDGVRYKGGMNLIEAFVWNVGSCRPDAKGETQGGSPTKGERTNAGHSGGITCSSEELPVMGRE